MARWIKIAIVAAVIGALSAVALPALASLSESKKTIPLVYPGLNSAKAGCDKKAHVGFGGFKTVTQGPADSDHFGFIDAMGPDKDAESWGATGHNLSAFYDAKLTSYAYCFKGAKPKVVRATRSAPTGAGKATTVEATCPKGKTLIGGGFDSTADPEQGDRIIPTLLERAGNDQAWQVSIVNEGSKSVKITAIAICGKGKSPKRVEGSATIKQFAAPRNAVADCPKGREVVFAGMEAEYDDAEGVAALPNDLYRSSKSAVTAVAVFGGGIGDNNSAKLRAFAYCG